MWNAVMLLTKLQLRNTWGINQIRYGNDSKQWRRFMLLLVTYLILGAMVVFYSGILTYGLVYIGAGELIFPMLIVVIAMITLFFTIYKAGSVLFDIQKYEALIALPMPAAAVVVSRFLSMYMQNAVLTAAVVIPATLVYGMNTQASLLFYLLMLLGIFTIPLLPMTIATAIGAGITAIGARMKHKNLVIIVLSFAVVIAVIILPLLVPAVGASPEFEDSFTIGHLQAVMVQAADQLYAVYPPARWFTLGVTSGQAGLYLLFTVVSVGVFIILVAVVQRQFKAISSALMTHRATADYQLGELSAQSVGRALYHKERKLYFSSNIYVLNTMMGYLMMVVFALGIFFIGMKEMEQILGFYNITAMLPYLLALLCSITVTTTCAVSIEGKRWWLLKSLPITMKQLIDSKLLVNLTLAVPCWLLAVLLLLIRVRPTLIEGLFIFLIPAAYILFSSVMGIFLNCEMPNFDWDSEKMAVKQGAPLMLSIVIGIGSSILPLILVFLVGEYAWVLMLINVIVMLVGTAFLYRSLLRMDVRKI